jgi:uncharacterized membrane protein
MLRSVRNHATLFEGIAAAVVASVVAARYMQVAQAVLVGWCAGVILYLALAARIALGASAATMRQRAKGSDVSMGFISAVTLAAAVMSITAIIFDLGQAGQHGASALSITLVVLTLLLSWLFQQVVFAFHYAHQFYQDGKSLAFPGTDEPDYWDFLYFATVIGMTAQVSDVNTCKPLIRRLIMVHSIISFFFNTAILALGVNLTAGLVH